MAHDATLFYVAHVSCSRSRARARLLVAVLATLALVPVELCGTNASAELLPHGAEAWAEHGTGGIRGITVGPIENRRHANVGYGTPACERTMAEATRLGASWVSLTPFGRTANLRPTGIDSTFETPFLENRAHVLSAVRQAHAAGLRVLLVPHLWVETGEWRALIDPGDDAAWARWARAYRSFVLTWAKVAREGDVEMFSIGVELRSWVTTRHFTSMLPIIADVRRVYSGLLTYSANWDDVGDTLIWDALNLVGINAFYPLAEHEGATVDELAEGGRTVAKRVEAIALGVERPVVLTEVGYTTRANVAVRPWEWPDEMTHVAVDEQAQSAAYQALLAPLLDSRQVAGFFVWRFYADPDNVSQEAEWGFSPRGKLAELVMRDAFAAHWAVDGRAWPGDALTSYRARTPGFFGLELEP